MKYLISGGKGFLGREISRELRGEILSLGRSADNDVVTDLSREVPELPKVDVVIHAAAKAHSVPATAAEEQEFYDINEKGTAHLLQALRLNPPSQLIFISTVAVYGVESGVKITEDHPLRGDSPYARSKIAAEKMLLQWGADTGTPVLILRLPLIAGSNAPGNLGKMVQAIRNNRYFNIGGGRARKSMVMAADVGKLINESFGKTGVYNLTDGQHPSFAELSQSISAQLHKKPPASIPLFLARILGWMGNYLSLIPINSDGIDKMTKDLCFDDSRARRELSWQGRPVIKNFRI